MTLHHRVLAGAYHSLRAAKAIGRRLGVSAQHRLRVLIYHDIAPNDHGPFAAQLRWLARSWKFVPPDHFAAMVSGEEKIRGSNLLLTFDDGFASNRNVAEDVLNPMGIRALFFVVSDFVELADRCDAREFITRHFFPNRPAGALPGHWSNMRWMDLEALLQQGHCVGGHTRTHARLSQITTGPDLEREIIESADILAQRLGTPIEHFAYAFGDLASFSPTALAVARRRFRFVHSGLRGDNARGVSPLALRRDVAAMQNAVLEYSVFSNRLLGAFLEGAADVRYSASRAQLDAWSLLTDQIPR